MGLIISCLFTSFASASQIASLFFGSLFEVFSYFLSFSFRRLGAWLTIKKKMRSLSLSSWYDSILAPDGLFFLSFFLFPLRSSAYVVKQVHPFDWETNSPHNFANTSFRPICRDICQTSCRPADPVKTDFSVSLFVSVFFLLLTFFHYGWDEIIDPLSHLQGQRKFSLKCFNFSQPEYIHVNHAVNTLTKREGKGTLWSILVATKSIYFFWFTIFTFSASTGLFISECF
ncbi:unnamed protein product [Acanthosepion pharaonis]|uniref:Uncharacterized protein n=1 Tax=Acanthosepion pharaonis TaxID=158019 RepID=A0A812DJI4_ACAPH|nr:unnamed protein product [Sepia pharaonis]